MALCIWPRSLGTTADEQHLNTVLPLSDCCHCGLRSRCYSIPNALQRAIPVSRIPWNVPAPGYCKANLVHHGSPEPRG